MSDGEEVFVYCKICGVPSVEDCFYQAKNIEIPETKDVIYIRSGYITQVCKYCGEDENYSLANNICYSCNSELQLRKNVVCKECEQRAILLENICQSEFMLDIPYEDRFDCPIGYACTDCSWRIILPCQHTCCLECFCSAMQNDALTMSDIIYHPDTNKHFVRCFQCDNLLSEDYLRLGGMKSWEIYKERIVLQHNENILYRCPLKQCGGLISSLPPKEEQRIVLCPFCHRYICRHCDEEAVQGRCPSSQAMELSKTFRRCPRCNTPVTHYFGHGCHHIGPDGGCPGCRARGEVFHWCYYCLKGGSEYPESCKKNHWFCKLTGCDICPVCPICNEGNMGPPKPCKCE